MLVFAYIVSPDKGKADGSNALKTTMNNLYITVRDKNIMSVHYNGKYAKCEVVTGQAYSLGDAENAAEYGAGTGACFNIFGDALTVFKLSF